MTYFRDVYDAVPQSIEQVREHLKDWRQRYIFDVERLPAEDPVQSGFELKCDDIQWHVRWNTDTNHVEAFQAGRQVAGYNNENNSSKTSAKRLVEDIHRAKLMSMPEDFSDIADWIKKPGRR